MDPDSRPTLVIIGNGMVCHKFCEKLVQNGANAQFHIVVFGEEPMPAYDRVHLTEFFGSPDTVGLLLASEDWYSKHGIELQLGTSVESIDREQRVIRTNSDLYMEYDKLVFATGSRPFVPPIEGINLPGVFVYRTIDDLKEIENYSHNVKSAAAIGGGLLGLEVVRALDTSREAGDIETHIVHRSSHLMSRQLNADAAVVLQNKVEEMGIQVHLNKQTTHITAEGAMRVMNFTEGPPLPVDMIVISTGIRPRDELARACNLACSAEGGIEVNDELQTSDSHIYAIGECASHNGIFHGLVPPGYKMAEVLAENLTEVEKRQRFESPDTSITLKLMGVDVAVFGDYRSESAHITFTNSNVYRQLMRRNGRFVGATVVGIWREMGKVQQAVATHQRMWFWNAWRFRWKGKLWREQDLQGVQNWSEDTVVCNCMGVKRGELSHASTAGCTTVTALSETTGAGTVCGTCYPLLEELIIGFPTASHEHASSLPLRNLKKGLLGASFIGLFLVLLIYFSKPIPFSATVQTWHYTIDALWRDNFWKQITGYTLLGFSAVALILSLRKRWTRFSFGNFGTWRFVHTLIGVGTLIFLIAHTGFRFGNNLNQILMVSFLMLNLVGTLAGGITAIAAKQGNSATTYRWQNWLIQAHTVLFWAPSDINFISYHCSLLFLMNWIRNHLFWVCWILFTVSVGGYFSFSLLTDQNKGIFLPGETSQGHYQIETKCDACHTPMMGVKQEACLQCHAQELNIANDTHPEKKFTDPRNADRVAILDARKCITCHVEHEPDMTHPMGLTLPKDYCLRCHADIGTERPSHKDLGFDTCASAGCHNFHDNRALYEDFLSKHFDEPDILDEATVPEPNVAQIRQLLEGITSEPLRAAEQDAPTEVNFDATLLHEWERTTHAQTGINCQDCHMQNGVWKNELTHEACRTCHSSEVDGFLGGRHGMRLAQALSPMTPSIARLPMKSDAHDKNLTCVSCHNAHRFDRQYAAVDACLSCHNDIHSLAYTESPHFALWEAETNGNGDSR